MNISFHTRFSLCFNSGSGVKSSEPKLKQKEKSTIVLIFHEKRQFLFSFDHFYLIFFDYFLKCMVLILLQLWFRDKVIWTKVEARWKMTTYSKFLMQIRLISFSFDHFNVIFFEYFFWRTFLTLLQFWFRGKFIWTKLEAKWNINNSSNFFIKISSKTTVSLFFWSFWPNILRIFLYVHGFHFASILVQG